MSKSYFSALKMLVWIAVILVPFGSAVLRQAKIKDGIFIPEKGMVIADHVISTHYVSSPLDCSFQCTSTHTCLSYNYKHRGIGAQDVCQLNNATRKTAQGSYKVDVDFVHYFDQSETFKSCLDYLRNGAIENGIYAIKDTNGSSFKVYCDFTTEPRSAWTLIHSFALKNKNMAAFSSGSFASNLPVDENSPNWQAYRLSLEKMRLLSTVSTHVRATTGFEEYGVDFTDYLRMKTSSLDILSSVTLHGVCKMVEFIHIRHFAARNIMVPFWHEVNQYPVHVGSSFTGQCSQFANASVGSVYSEDNFGLYGSVNPNFRGSKNGESTTQWWFGGYL